MVCISLLCYALFRVTLFGLGCLLRRTPQGLYGLISSTLSVGILCAIFAVAINYNLSLIRAAKYQYHKTECILHQVTAVQQTGLWQYSATVKNCYFIINGYLGNVLHDTWRQKERDCAR
jgi:hypothetical protein